MTDNPGCTCDQQTPANPICPACQRVHAEVVAELYATDAAFREELDRWAAADSPEGQAIVRRVTA